MTWAFEFEDQPYFDGFRDLATNGIDKPVLNVFRMFGMMTGKRLSRRQPRRGNARIDAGWRGEGQSRHRTRWPAATIAPSRFWSRIITIPASPGRMLPMQTHDLRACPPAGILVEHFRVDAEHSNSYEAWKKMGSPQQAHSGAVRATGAGRPTGQSESPRWMTPQDGQVQIAFSLPRHAVSLLRLTR